MDKQQATVGKWCPSWVTSRKSHKNCKICSHYFSI